MKGRIIVTGAGGRLGSELCRLLGAKAAPFPHAALDVTDRDAVRRTLAATAPTALINATAYNAVDKAEVETEACRALNEIAVDNQARAAREFGIPFIHVSTDYVFGGDSSRTTPYTETDAPAPQSVYAHSKLAGEAAALQYAMATVVRTCGLYGPTREFDSFPEKILAAARAGKPLRVVVDQVCSPTFVPHLARAIVFLLEKNARGLFHVVNQGEATWHAFACEMLRLSKFAARVSPITAADWSAPAARPKYSVLSCAKYLALGGPPLPAWTAALQEYASHEAD